MGQGLVRNGIGFCFLSIAIFNDTAEYFNF